MRIKEEATKELTSNSKKVAKDLPNIMAKYKVVQSRPSASISIGNREFERVLVIGEYPGPELSYSREIYRMISTISAIYAR